MGMSKLKLMKGYTWEEALQPTSKFPNGRVQYPCLIEPKVDEIRVQVQVHGDDVQYLSYAGKPLHNFPTEWSDEFRDIADWFGVREFDCGILVNGNFNDSYRFVRSSKGLPDDLRGAEVVLHLYDLPTFDLPYVDRREMIETIIEFASSGGDDGIPFRLLDAYVCDRPEDVAVWYNWFLKAGFEGGMVKAPEGKYKRGRSWGWLKLKPGSEADAKVVGLIEAVSEKGKPLGRVGAFRVVLEDGTEAQPAAGALTHDEAEKLWYLQDEYLANEPWIVFKFMERDRQGGYRHPRFFRHREEK